MRRLKELRLWSVKRGVSVSWPQLSSQALSGAGTRGRGVGPPLACPGAARTDHRKKIMRCSQVAEGIQQGGEDLFRRPGLGLHNASVSHFARKHSGAGIALCMPLWLCCVSPISDGEASKLNRPELSLTKWKGRCNYSFL